MVFCSHVGARVCFVCAGDIDGSRAGRAEAAGVERGDVSPDKLFTLPCGNASFTSLVVTFLVRAI